MRPDDEALLALCLDHLDALSTIVADLGDDLANARPSLPGANSPYAILFHCLGAMRRWSCTVNRGIAIPRDRDAEFTAAGPVGPLLDAVALSRAAFIEDVAQVDLDAPPAAQPASHELQPWLVSCRGVLLHVVCELAQHRGQLEITRDLLVASAGRGGVPAGA